MNPLAEAILGRRAMRRLLASIGRSPSGNRLLMRLCPHQGPFASFDAACRAAQRRGVYVGHEHREAISVHLKLAEVLRPSDYAVLFWLSQMPLPLRILDFGGNVGNLYYSYLPYLASAREPASIRWLSYDLPSINATGRSLAAERHAETLSFTDTLEAVSDAEVLLASGSLHYWEPPIEALFECLPSAPVHVLVNRSPFHDTADPFVTIQWSGSYAVPCLVRNSAQFIDTMEHLGYVLVNRWKALELAIHMPLFPDRSVPHYQGFYFRHERATSEVPATGCMSDQPAVIGVRTFVEPCRRDERAQASAETA